MTEIAHAEFGQEFRKKMRASVFTLEDRVNVHHIQGTLTQLSVWPICEALHIVEESLCRPISEDDKQRLVQLKDTQLNELIGGLSLFFSIPEGHEKYSFHVVRPEEEEYLSKSLDLVRVCYPKSKTPEILGRLLKDIALGGSVLYFLEKDNKPVVYNKLFLSKKDDRPVFFYDAIENGDVTARNIQDWKKRKRMYELVYCFAFAAHMARSLDVSTVAYADRELEELGAHLGLRKRYVMPDGPVRKVGLPTHPENLGEVVYQNRVYKADHNKHRALTVSLFQEGNRLIDGFFHTYTSLLAKRFDPQDIPRYHEHVQYLTLTSQAILMMHSGTLETRQKISEIMDILREKET